MEIIYKPIGIIYTPFDSIEGMPIQPTSETSGRGMIEILSEFTDALKDLAGFSHIYLLYHFHKVGQSKLLVTPFLDNTPRGVFATRAPSRPNAIGLSLVKLERIEGNYIYIDGVDMLNETPLLDIKPYIPEFESIDDVRVGWLEQGKDRVRRQKSDDRFR
jgi:tRNA-Thr(GGU) m(6)t(6)A37 methyltransferase TsaA